MNINDVRFKEVVTVYVHYLDKIPIATTAQSKLADDIYHYLLELRKVCVLFNDEEIPKPENSIHKVIEER